jgi:hypothetical protein
MRLNFIPFLFVASATFAIDAEPLAPSIVCLPGSSPLLQAALSQAAAASDLAVQSVRVTRQGPPRNLRLVNRVGPNITLRWDRAQGAVSAYKVRRKKLTSGGDVIVTLASDLLGPDVTTHQDTLPGKGIYEYRVTSYGSGVKTSNAVRVVSRRP